jgi:hypothetical protein
LAFYIGLFLRRDGKVEKLINVVTLADDAIISFSIESVLQNAASIKVIFFTALGAKLLNKGIENKSLLCLNLFPKVLIKASCIIL